MKYLILLLPLLLMGCSCKDPYMGTIEKVHLCADAYRQNAICVVTLTDGTRRKIDANRAGD